MLLTTLVWNAYLARWLACGWILEMGSALLPLSSFHNTLILIPALELLLSQWFIQLSLELQIISLYRNCRLIFPFLRRGYRIRAEMFLYKLLANIQYLWGSLPCSISHLKYHYNYTFHLHPYPLLAEMHHQRLRF